MCRKNLKEQKCCMLRTGDGTMVAVNREVYLEWHRAGDWVKCCQKHSSTESASDGMKERGCIFGEAVNITDSMEAASLREFCREKMREALGKLDVQDAYLIQLLYFEGAAVKDAAYIFGCSRKSIQNRKKRILGELNQILQGLGMQGGFF